MHRRLPLITALAAIAMVLVAATPAGAASLAHERAYAPTVRQSAPVSPSGCYQQADHPHRSLHLGWIAGEVKTQCRNPVPRITQVAQLWESRWWGWDRVGTKGNKTVYWKKYQPIWANVTCRHSELKVTGSGTIVDVDDDTYYASTESAGVNNPCGL